MTIKLYLPFALLLMALTACKNNATSKRTNETTKSVADSTAMQAYLLTYFKDDTHSLHMALSSDGYSFTDINEGNPVVAGDTIASQKGIR
ncbi:MAG TPA: beta-xylosidase, partial [Leeuwenhoekiella sp.]|nr:beta-xylosidase [Leeuwenhoekiella sp.]